VFAQALVPPSVPAASSRVRLAVMASHRAEELRAAAGVLAEAARAVGFDPRMSLAFDEPDEEEYEPEADDPYAAAPSTGPYDYEQVARAA
jgi:glycine C-acetyltransferase/8-amino-7-oxononanoate synthase